MAEQKAGERVGAPSSVRKQTKGERVAVALSGGVDSSVVLAMLQEQGYDAVAFYMKNWTAAIDAQGFCPWVEESASARTVADQLDVPFYVLDFEDCYREQVTRPFFAAYEAGLTPNPDVLCNQFVKFAAFWQRVQQYGCTKMATGHYARIGRYGGQLALLKGVDPGKDQSYFLWAMPLSVLSQLLLPLGGLKKTEVRHLAERYGLPTATRPDSQGICFIGPISVAQFLRDNLPSHPGPIVNEQGLDIGRHDGLAFATIGQRRTVGLHGQTEPLYVAKKQCATNTLTVAPAGHPSLFSRRFQVADISKLTEHWPDTADVAVRYHAGMTRATLAEDGAGLTVSLAEPVRAVTPGQSAVFYDGDVLLGGGVIQL